MVPLPLPLLLLLNQEFCMGSVFFLLLFLLSRSVFLSSAQEEGKPHSACQLVGCEKLKNWLPFPFNESNPECGLFEAVNCSNETPLIQLERGGRFYRLKNSSQANTIVIEDEGLQEDFKQDRCGLIHSLNLPRSPSVSFEPLPTPTELTLFKCLRALDIDIPTRYTYNRCNDFIIHYDLTNHIPVPPPLPLNQPNHTSTPPAESCTTIHYPINMSIGLNNLVALLTSDITLQVNVSQKCLQCRSGGGQCQDLKEGKFRCENRDRDDYLGEHTSEHEDAPTDAQHKSIKNDQKLELAIGLGLVVSVIGIGILLALTFYSRRKSIISIFWNKQTGKHQNIEAFLRNHGSLTPKRYRYSEVKKMTRSFKDRVGEGGYGVVYKGKLLNGDLVAVKVLSEAKDNGEEFINEIASISRTSHVNIVNLLGFCFEGPKRALIYEYMSNGSLEKYICNGNHLQTNCQLGWETLYKIAVGIARGLEYLHRGCNTRILHFDIKPHNILLTEDFCPKISDFGLAKLCTRKDSIISMLGTKGTPGYIAPEVFSRIFGGVSHKSDVYSYGMMVLDMVGGRKEVDGGSSHISEAYFPDSIYKCIEEQDLGPLEFMDEERECTRKMMIVGLWCIQTRASDRPAMCRVLDMLEGRLGSLQIPPKPFLFSPPRLLQDSSSTTIS